MPARPRSRIVHSLSQRGNIDIATAVPQALSWQLSCRSELTAARATPKWAIGSHGMRSRRGDTKAARNLYKDV